MTNSQISKLVLLVEEAIEIIDNGDRVDIWNWLKRARQTLAQIKGRKEDHPNAI